MILNNLEVSIGQKNGVLVDFIREEMGLQATKTVCREGDCGSCIVLLGECKQNHFKFKAIVSCLFPLANTKNKHVLTLEGLLNGQKEHPLALAFLKNSSFQCGFCTPGFMMAIFAAILNVQKIEDFTLEWVVSYLDGNICRCTGYKSIERGIKSFIDECYEKFLGLNHNMSMLEKWIELKILPSTLLKLTPTEDKISFESSHHDSWIVAGGTDVFVQNPYLNPDQNVTYIQKKHPPIASVIRTNSSLIFSALMTVEEFRNLKEINEYAPSIKEDLLLFGSMPIRNMATLGGNIMNASPIADIVSILIALDAKLHTSKGQIYSIDDFYLGYKKTRLEKADYIEQIEISTKNVKYFKFKKLSKRKYLDIATVNSSILYTDNRFRISVGGVAATPLRLRQMEEYFLECFKASKQVEENEINKQLLKEIAPISDIRGTKEFKTQALSILLRDHYLECTLKIRSP